MCTGAGANLFDSGAGGSLPAMSDVRQEPGDSDEKSMLRCFLFASYRLNPKTTNADGSKHQALSMACADCPRLIDLSGCSICQYYVLTGIISNDMQDITDDI